MSKILVDSKGRIVGRFNLLNGRVDVAEGQRLVPGSASPLQSYYDEAIKEKAAPNFSFDRESISANGIDTATISGIPAHTLVTWPDGEVTEINDGLIEFAVDLAGTYAFIIDAVQYTKQEVTIEALA